MRRILFQMAILFWNLHSDIVEFLLHNFIDNVFQFINRANSRQAYTQRNRRFIVKSIEWTSRIAICGWAVEYFDFYLFLSAHCWMKGILTIIRRVYLRWPKAFRLNRLLWQKLYFSNAVLCVIINSISFDMKTFWKWSKWIQISVSNSGWKCAPCSCNWNFNRKGYKFF